MRPKKDIFILVAGMKQDKFKMGAKLSNFVALYMSCYLNYKEYKKHYDPTARKKEFNKIKLVRREKNVIDFTIHTIKECVGAESITMQQYGSVIAGLWMLELDHMIDIPDEFNGEITGYLGLILDVLISKSLQNHG